MFTPLAGPFELDGVPYRGSVQIAVVGGALQAVNSLGIDSYVQGVVPREMPSSWAPEALKAQAVVARSYALSHLHGGAFDLYKDTRSQVYGGIGAESRARTRPCSRPPARSSSTTARSRRRSSSRPRAAARPRSRTRGRRRSRCPYLVSVPDPYDTLSPYHNWGPLP